MTRRHASRVITQRRADKQAAKSLHFREAARYAISRSLSRIISRTGKRGKAREREREEKSRVRRVAFGKLQFPQESAIFVRFGATNPTPEILHRFSDATMRPPSPNADRGDRRGSDRLAASRIGNKDCGEGFVRSSPSPSNPRTQECAHSRATAVAAVAAPPPLPPVGNYLDATTSLYYRTRARASPCSRLCSVFARFETFEGALRTRAYAPGEGGGARRSGV